MSLGKRVLTESLTMTSLNISCRQGDTLSVTISALGDISSRTNLYLTVKRSILDLDSESLIQISENDGLLYFQRAQVSDASQGDITVDDEAAGDLTLTLNSALTALFTPRKMSNYICNIKMITATAVQTLATGAFTITPEVTIG